MLSLQDFKTKYTGQQNVGDTPQNLGQCVGLDEVWTDNLGLPHTWGNAIDLLNDADPNSFDIIQNKLGDTSNYPSDGDLVILGKPYGKSGTKYFGHTGISIGSDGNTLRLFEQNDPDGSTPHMQDYDYSACLGWLHPKVTAPATGGLPANYDDLVHGSTQWDSTVQKYLPNDDPKHTDFSVLQTVIAGIQSSATASNNKVAQDAIDLAGANQQITNLEEKLALEEQQRQDDINSLQAQIKALNATTPANQKVIATLQGQVTALQGQLKQALDDKHTLAIELAQLQAGKQSWIQSVIDFLSKIFSRS